MNLFLTVDGVVSISEMMLAEALCIDERIIKTCVESFKEDEERFSYNFFEKTCVLVEEGIETEFMQRRMTLEGVMFIIGFLDKNFFPIRDSEIRMIQKHYARALNNKEVK